MKVFEYLLAIKTADLFDPLAQTAHIAIAVPFAMNRDGTAQSLQGLEVVHQTACLLTSKRVSWAIALGGHHLRNNQQTEGQWAAQALCRLTRSSKVLFEAISRDTHENALEALVLVSDLREGVFSHHSDVPSNIVLVVQTLQARRALATFRQAAARQGLPLHFSVLPTDARHWRDNAKRSLRHPVVFALREIFLAWPFFKLKGWA